MVSNEFIYLILTIIAFIYIVGVYWHYSSFFVGAETSGIISSRIRWNLLKVALLWPILEYKLYKMQKAIDKGTELLDKTLYDIKQKEDNKHNKIIKNKNKDD